MLSVLLFMDSLYYETNSQNVLYTARLLFSALQEGSLGGFFENPATAPLRWPGEVPAPYRLTLIGRDGVVLADSRLSPEGLENHGERPEVKAALAGSEGRARRSSESLGMELLYAALPVYDPAGRDGGGA